MRSREIRKKEMPKVLTFEPSKLNNTAISTVLSARTNRKRSDGQSAWWKRTESGKALRTGSRAPFQAEASKDGKNAAKARPISLDFISGADECREEFRPSFLKSDPSERRGITLKRRKKSFREISMAGFQTERHMGGALSLKVRTARVFFRSHL